MRPIILDSMPILGNKREKEHLRPDCLLTVSQTKDGVKCRFIFNIANEIVKHPVVNYSTLIIID